MCRSAKVKASNVNSHCYLVNDKKFNPRTMSKGNYLTKAITSSVKKLVGTAVKQNPDKNKAYIKKAFRKGLSLKLKGKVIKSSKRILVVKRVQVKRINGKLRIDITADPKWAVTDSANQI